MKRIFLLIVLFGFVVLLSSCFGLKKDFEEITKFSDNIEEVSEQKEAFYENVSSKISNEAEKSAFTADYFLVSTSDIAAAIYYSIISLYAVSPKLVSADVTKEKDVYTIKDNDSTAKIKFNNKTNSSSLEIYDSDKLTYIMESIKVKDNQYAYQLVITNEDKTYCVYQFLLDGNDGKISVNVNATTKPTSIYDNLKAIDSKFANEGTRIYKLENGNYQFSGDLGIYDPDDGNKKVTDFTISSGLKNQYVLGETLDINNISIKVTYEDNTTTIIPVTAAMIVGNNPSTSTLGNISFKLAYKSIEKTFSFEVIEGQVSQEIRLYNSFNSFYNSLAFNTTSFIMSNMGNSALSASENREAFNFFTNDVTNNTLGMWSHFNLLSESVSAIKAHHDGQLGTVIFPDPINEYNKQAYCTYNEETNAYSVGYWSPKELNQLYWFESTISYDGQTDSLKADIQAGINEYKLNRAHIEYQKVNDSYAAFVYYPQDENKDQGKYDSMHFFFKGIDGRVVLNRWVDEIPISIYKSSVGLDYATNGDIVLAIANNGANINFNNNFQSAAANFYYSFIRNNDEYENSIECRYIQKIADKASEYYYNTDDFTIDVDIFRTAISFKEAYDNKVFTFMYDSNEVTVDINNDVTKFIISEEGSSTETYTIKYLTDKLFVEYYDGLYYLKFELVKKDNIYYVQKVEENGYDTELYKWMYQITECIYTDINNITLTKTDESFTKGISIYDNIPATFSKAGDYQYLLINDTFSYKEALNVYFDPQNGEDSFKLKTDLDGYIILPPVKGANFLGWYDEVTETKVGISNQKVRFKETMVLFAKYS